MNQKLFIALNSAILGLALVAMWFAVSPNRVPDEWFILRVAAIGPLVAVILGSSNNLINYLKNGTH